MGNGSQRIGQQRDHFLVMQLQERVTVGGLRFFPLGGGFQSQQETVDAVMVETEASLFGPGNGNHFLNRRDKKGCEEGEFGLKTAKRNHLGTRWVSQKGEKEVLTVGGREEERLAISSSSRSHRKQGKDGFRRVESKSGRHDRRTEANRLGELCQRGQEVREEGLNALPLRRLNPLGILKKAKDEEKTLIAEEATDDPERLKGQLPVLRSKKIRRDSIR